MVSIDICEKCEHCMMRECDWAWCFLVFKKNSRYLTNRIYDYNFTIPDDCPYQLEQMMRADKLVQMIREEDMKDVK